MRILTFLFQHPVVVAMVLWMLLACLFSTAVGKVGAAIGALAAWIVVAEIDTGRLLRLGDWLARHPPIGLGLMALGLVGVALVRRHLRTAGASVGLQPVVAVLQATSAVAMSALLTTVVMFGVAWGSRGHVIRSYTDPSLIDPGGDYVALGDSYSAGEGLPPYLEGTNSSQDNCHQSSAAFAFQLRFRPTHSGHRLFRACSGARIADVLHSRLPSANEDVPPQVFSSAILNGSTRLVTLTMGGNDMHFSDVLQHCFRVRNCLEAEFRIPGPDQNDAGLPPPAPLGVWADKALPVVQARLENLYKEIRLRAPAARIVVIGYPQLFPTGGRTLSYSDCDTVLNRVDANERAGLADFQARFNQAIYKGAVATEVEYVDPGMTFSLHEVCGVLGGMIKGARLVKGGLDRGAFHPTAEGQKALACLVSRYLARYPTPRDPFDRVRVVDDVFVMIRTKPAPGTWLDPLAC